jgi:ADP-ribose pyrophosphatase YjhB (NUDIX family)
MNSDAIVKPFGAEGAAAVIFDDHQRVLLHRRRDFNVWALPGGQIELNETGEAAATREVCEETGYAIEIQRLVGEYSRPQMTNGTQLIYVGCVVGGTPIQQGPETREVKWFPLNALPLSLPTAHRVVIQDTIANFSKPIKKTIHISFVEAMIFHVLRWFRDL